jgi:hypothetical protein
LISESIKIKLYLGPMRIAWDLGNQHHLQISPYTIGWMKKAMPAEMNLQPGPVVWRWYERKHPHSLWHGDSMEKVTLTYEDRTAAAKVLKSFTLIATVRLWRLLCTSSQEQPGIPETLSRGVYSPKGKKSE